MYIISENNKINKNMSEEERLIFLRDQIWLSYHRASDYLIKFALLNNINEIR